MVEKPQGGERGRSRVMLCNGTGYGKTREGVLKSWRVEGEHVEGDERFPGLSWKRGDQLGHAWISGSRVPFNPRSIRTQWIFESALPEVRYGGW